MRSNQTYGENAPVKKSYYRPGRALHLIDPENLMGGPGNGLAALSRTLSRYRGVARVADGDHVTIGVNLAFHAPAKAYWPSARVVSQGGPDGADIRLIGEVGNPRWTAPRYDRLVIGSGDGDFVEVAQVYRDYGLEVDVVARRRSLSAKLAAVANRVRIIPEIALPEAA